MLGPSGAWWLRPRVERHIDVLPGHRVVEAQRHLRGVRLGIARPDGTVTGVAVDHVLVATGYRPDVTGLPWLDLALRNRVATVAGFPRLSARSESSVPGLFFTGLAAAGSFGPLLRFGCGTRVAARRIAGTLADRPRT